MSHPNNRKQVQRLGCGAARKGDRKCASQLDVPLESGLAALSPTYIAREEEN